MRRSPLRRHDAAVGSGGSGSGQRPTEPDRLPDGSHRESGIGQALTRATPLRGLLEHLRGPVSDGSAAGACQTGREVPRPRGCRGPLARSGATFAQKRGTDAESEPESSTVESLEERGDAGMIVLDLRYCGRTEDLNLGPLPCQGIHDTPSTSANAARPAGTRSLSFVIYSLLLYVTRDFRGMECPAASSGHGSR